jgi:hypothetical protein
MTVLKRTPDVAGRMLELLYWSENFRPGHLTQLFYGRSHDKACQRMDRILARLERLGLIEIGEVDGGPRWVNLTPRGREWFEGIVTARELRGGQR